MKVAVGLLLCIIIEFMTLSFHIVDVTWEFMQP